MLCSSVFVYCLVSGFQVMDRHHQLACFLAILSLSFPHASFVPCVPYVSSSSLPAPSLQALRLQALFSLCKLGHSAALAQAEFCFIGLQLRKKCWVSPVCGSLPSADLSWPRKRRLLTSHRNVVSEHLKFLQSSADKLWTLLLGPDFRFNAQYAQWRALRDAAFASMFAKLRSSLPATRKPQPRSASCNIVNTSNVPLSPFVTNVLSKGPKFCLNVKPSRLDVAACITKISSAISNPQMASSFTDQAVKRVSHCIDANPLVTKRTRLPFSAVNKELCSKGLHLLQTDKTARFALLPVNSFETKSRKRSVSF